MENSFYPQLQLFTISLDFDFLQNLREPWFFPDEEEAYTTMLIQVTSDLNFKPKVSSPN